MRTLTWVDKLHVASYLVAMTGLLLLFFTGFAPPGVLISGALYLILALLILVGHWRWITIVGSIVDSV